MYHGLSYRGCLCVIEAANSEIIDTNQFLLPKVTTKKAKRREEVEPHSDVWSHSHPALE